eukprot:5747142-Alexandrium_andersonii.AAC.1
MPDRPTMATGGCPSVDGRRPPPRLRHPRRHEGQRLARIPERRAPQPVSYTHLTLPTICSV